MSACYPHGFWLNQSWALVCIKVPPDYSNVLPILRATVSRLLNSACWSQSISSYILGLFGFQIPLFSGLTCSVLRIYKLKRQAWEKQLNSFPDRLPEETGRSPANTSIGKMYEASEKCHLPCQQIRKAQESPG